LDDLKPAKIKSVRPKKRLISLRLETPQIEALKTIASQKGLGDLSLVRLWVAEKLSQESHQYSIHQG
jgi:predicted DNA binding CopG/RHH family protein